MTTTSSSKPVLVIVAALLPTFGIGLKGTLPWKLSKEMKYFRSVTSITTDPSKQNAVIMGRRTWDSIPVKFRPLPKRMNVIITRQDLSTVKPIEGVKFENSIEGAVKMLAGLPEIEKIFIIGGGEVYNLSVSSGLVDNLLITEIKHSKGEDVEMDTFLDKDYILGNFDKVGRDGLLDFIGEVDAGEEVTVKEGDFEYEFALYKRK
ncbi:hypothetical protein WICPIJ_009654 [Wickerhamomyces pijperi]|uniref:Dihydrofolate reductase n=1 Tax=Wickerhamomyces pijperi TaxID=599730 RepID=A0A9P8TCK2_WICPI|nr:hypothetical protein WICPIJ_009654 [Wickerhamomyces pijperi]